MAAADELYLLFQKCNDICDENVTSWEKQFTWLEEVLIQAKESRGQAVISKTPMARKTKRKKADAETIINEVQMHAPEEPSCTGVRKSSRAAAKIALQKNREVLTEISNIGTKLRRPSTPKKQKETVPIFVRQYEELKPPSDEADHCERVNNGSMPVSSADEVVQEIQQERVSVTHSCRSDSGIGAEKQDYENEDKERGTIKHKLDILKEESCTVDLTIEKKDTRLNTAHIDCLDQQTLIMPPPVLPSVKPRVLKETAPLMEEGKGRVYVTDTKTQTEDKEVDERPVRMTRTKKRKLEEENAVREVFDAKEQAPTNDAVVGSMPAAITVETHAPEATCNRVTRSKVRKLINNNNAQAAPISAECRTPKQHKTIPFANACSPTTKNKCIPSQSPRAKMGSPFRSAVQNRKMMQSATVTYVEEVKINEMQSPVKVIKHMKPTNNNISTGKATRTLQTPTASSSSLYKKRIQGLQNSCTYLGSGNLLNSGSLLGSGNIYSSRSNKHPFTSSSPNISSSKILGSLSEVNKHKNIVTGISSFITKVQPSKETKEEVEERKQEELMRKKEKEEETRRKKEELMKFRAEEQKRKNEERMRRVQETREARERKAAEVRHLQEKEKRMKEERLKEERERKKLLAAKKAEEAKQLRMREQEEFMQQLERERKTEKQREEERKAEAVRQRLEEQKRLMEERLMSEKIAKIEYEMKEKVARERELQKKKANETDVATRTENQNATFTTEPSMQNTSKAKCSPQKPGNATFTKPPADTSGQDSYEMTPVPKKVKKKVCNADDYGIDDLRSDDSTDEEGAPKKQIPLWAKGDQLRKSIFNQEFYPPCSDKIFPPRQLLKMPDLSIMFVRKRSRFFKRTSSAIWNTPPYKVSGHDV